MARKPHRRRQAGIPKPGHPSDCAAHRNSLGTAGFDSERLGVLRTNGVSIMMRKIAIGLAAAAIAIGGSTLSASAAKGGGGSGPHGGTVMGGPHGGGGGYGRPSAGRAYGMGPRAYGFHGRGYEHRRPYPYRYGHYKYPYRYGYYKTYPSHGGSCWRWTPEGRVWVCGYQRPSYGYRYGYYKYPYQYGHRPYGGYGHYRPSYGRGPSSGH